jgi:anion-transporting  ArsA/GET3 family ATPase
MELDELLKPKILIVSGKGGVGKTTVSAALALVAARAGHKVCIAEVDQKGTLPQLFGRGGRRSEDRPALTYEPREIAAGVWGMNISPEQALAEYLDVQYHMRRISKAFTSTHFVDYITTAAPGLKDILVLGKIWYLERDRSGRTDEFDTIIVDAPAAGHMLTFLSAPMGLSDALRVGPVRKQSDWLIEMLRDPERTRVHLVTLPEEMPVTETLETSAALEDRIGINSGVVFANAVYTELLNEKEEKLLETWIETEDPAPLLGPAGEVGLNLDDEDVEALLSYGRFLGARRRIQTGHLTKLRKGLNEPVAELPFLFSAGLALPDIENLADVIEEQVQKL